VTNAILLTASMTSANFATELRNLNLVEIVTVWMLLSIPRGAFGQHASANSEHTKRV
jgi:hypothetical protein